MFNPGSPIPDELRLVEEEVFGSTHLGFAMAPRFQNSIETRELEQGMVEGGVEDVGGRNTRIEKSRDRLQQ